MSISVWFWNSVTRPRRWTVSPADRSREKNGLAGGTKTKTPSEVSGSESGFGSWMKKPRMPASPWKSPVTTPSVLRIWLLAVLVVPEPWMSWIGVNGASHGVDRDRA